MVRPLVVALSGLFAVASARGDLQLTPRVDEFELDGTKMKQLAFSDGDQKVTYQSPRGWDYSGSATLLTLRPPGKPQAEATVSIVPLSKPAKFDDEALKTLVSEVTSSVPKGSENVVVISQEKNPLLINRKETFLVVVGYRFYGQNYNRSVLFVNREKQQIRCQLVAREGDFKDLQKAFLGSQYTWHNL
jgi:hypothetical protein